MTTDMTSENMVPPVEVPGPGEEVEYYHSGMMLDSSARKFTPTGTRGWLFHHAGVDARDQMKPLRRSKLARLTRGRIQSVHLRNISSQRDHEHWEDDVLIHATKWFEILPQGFRLKTKGDVNEAQMNKILRAATELMLHPIVSKGNARGALQFRLVDGNFFIATWNNEKAWFDIQSGAVVPILREGSSPWKLSIK